MEHKEPPLHNPDRQPRIERAVSWMKHMWNTLGEIMPGDGDLSADPSVLHHLPESSRVRQFLSDIHSAVHPQDQDDLPPPGEPMTIEQIAETDQSVIVKMPWQQ